MEANNFKYQNIDQDIIQGLKKAGAYKAGTIFFTYDGASPAQRYTNIITDWSKVSMGKNRKDSTVYFGKGALNTEGKVNTEEYSSSGPFYIVTSINGTLMAKVMRPEDMRQQIKFVARNASKFQNNTATQNTVTTPVQNTTTTSVQNTATAPVQNTTTKEPTGAEKETGNTTNKSSTPAWVNALIAAGLLGTGIVGGAHIAKRSGKNTTNNFYGNAPRSAPPIYRTTRRPDDFGF